MPRPMKAEAQLHPDFTLTVFEGAEDVELNIELPNNPDVRRHASLALLYGLAIMSLDADGTIEKRVDELLTVGPISEVDACNRIALLI
jgi:hypothetical protein